MQSLDLEQFKLIPLLLGVGFRGHGAWGMGAYTAALCPRDQTASRRFLPPLQFV